MFAVMVNSYDGIVLSPLQAIAPWLIYNETTGGRTIGILFHLNRKASEA